MFEAWEKRLKAVLTDDEFHGTGRTFSKQLKRELFDQIRACSICGNEVKLLDDAVVDHVMHYWRGGKTVPDNARLAHRWCNSERGGH